MFIYPGAFVNIREELRDLAPLKQLKIYCAGAWHNAVLGLVRALLQTSRSVLLTEFAGRVRTTDVHAYSYEPAVYRSSWRFDHAWCASTPFFVRVAAGKN